MINRPLIYLTAVMGLYSFALSVTGIFLPNYFLGAGLSVNQIVLWAATLFATLGAVPILTLRFLPKLFERLLSVGLLLSTAYYLLIGFVRDPVVLGFILGLSFATFWPAFNLLLFRLTNIRHRGLAVSLLYIVVPSVTSIAGPLLGGLVINFLKFDSLFIFAAILALSGFFVSLKINYSPSKWDFSFPKIRLLLLFSIIIVFFGFGDVGFVVYPLFLHQLTGGFLGMGLIASVLAIIFAVVSLVAGRISRVEKHRIDLATLGVFFGSVWVIALAFVRDLVQLLGISIFSGLAGAFGALLFAIYGDFFKREQHAALVVLWEMFLMLGRLGNLIPVVVFINKFDFKGYFLAVGIISLGAVMLFLFLRSLHLSGRIRVDAKQV